MAVFSAEDLAVFAITDFSGRMAAIREQIHPKLGQLGERMQQPLSARVGEPLHPHVAKHARRTKNPPEDTWVAFGPNNRGYKAYPYLGVAVSRFGVHVQLVAKPEARELRPAMADRLDAARPCLVLASFWNWDFRSAPEEQETDDAFWDARLHKMRLKTGGLDIGRTLPSAESDPDRLLGHMDDLADLYRTVRGLE
jgi:uncharacterized protein YktB (UPF0637 family)